MDLPRQFLPQISHLVSFEAAARLGSFSEAAREIGVTQGAVSRHIGMLEEQLGVKLFLREKQTVRLTAAGETYKSDITRALRLIGTATLDLHTNTAAGGALKLTILPTFCTRWLAPRLHRFLDANPGTFVNLTTKVRPIDFAEERQHAAIYFGDGKWAGTDSAFLMHEWVVPVCSSGFLKQHKISSPQDLAKIRLLHSATRRNAWKEWFEVHGIVLERTGDLVMDQYSALARAAISGLGPAILPIFLIRGELESGDLVRALDAPIKSKGAYYLVWPHGGGDYAPLAAFREWLLDEMHNCAGS